MGVIVRLGNAQVIEVLTDETTGEKTTVPRADLGEQITEIHPPELNADDTPLTAAQVVAEVTLAWSQHSPKAPLWLSCSDPALNGLLCAMLAKDGVTPTAGEPVAGASIHSLEHFDEFVNRYASGHELRTSAGADFQAAVMSSTGAQPAAANYIALSTNVTAPVIGDTALAGEINNAGGGLNRAQATYSHTNGTTTYTLTKVFTANANDGTSNTVAKIGIFNAATVGTLVFETLLTPNATLAPADQVTVTETVNM